jgi:dihydrofolate reductase
VMGRRMFDHGVGPWGDEPPFHAPVFVVTHRGREPLEKAGGTTYTFVSEGGPAQALELAREAAGEADVAVSGGADVIRQLVSAGLLDELQVHVVPILMGGGVSLFDGLGQDVRFEQVRGIASPGVTHLKLRVLR